MTEFQLTTEKQSMRCVVSAVSLRRREMARLLVAQVDRVLTIRHA